MVTGRIVRKMLQHENKSRFLARIATVFATLAMSTALYAVGTPVYVAAQSSNADCTSNRYQGTEYRQRCGCRDENPTSANCGIYAYVIDIINVLSAAVGVVIVTMIAVGGVQYSSAKDNPQAAAGAKNRILNAIIALFVFLFTYAFLQWLVPGGIF